MQQVSRGASIALLLGLAALSVFVTEWDADAVVDRMNKLLRKPSQSQMFVGIKASQGSTSSTVSAFSPALASRSGGIEASISGAISRLGGSSANLFGNDVGYNKSYTRNTSNVVVVGSGSLAHEQVSAVSARGVGGFDSISVGNHLHNVTSRNRSTIELLSMGKTSENSLNNNRSDPSSASLAARQSMRTTMKQGGKKRKGKNRIGDPNEPDHINFESPDNFCTYEDLVQNLTGIWKPDLTFHPFKCKLRRFNGSDARECLKGKSVVFLGDSLVRFQYMSLALLLEEGQFPDTQDSTRANVLVGRKPWVNYFLASSKRLAGTEWCNCFRPGAPWLSPRTQELMMENRYYYKKSHDISVSYLSLFGLWKMHGHLPGSCRSTQGSVNQGRRRADCSLRNLTRMAINGDAHVLTQEEWNTLESKSPDYDWEGMPWDVTRKVVPNLKPDIFVVNWGLWATIFSDVIGSEYVSKMFEAAQESVCSKGVRCVWRRTTVGKGIVVDEAHQLMYANKYKWDVVDAHSMTLHNIRYTDPLHPLGHVYNEINNAWLNQLCPPN